MAPRSIGVLISIITSSDDEGKVIKTFIENMDEVFSHPQTDITNNLVHLSDNHANSLRCHLYSRVSKKAISDFKDDFLNAGIGAEDFDTLGSRLCKRYKIAAVYDDIYLLGISLVEKSLHKDFKKLLTQAPPKKKPPAGTPAAKPPAADSVLPSAPQLHSCEKTLIDALTEIKSIVTAIRQENKDLKTKIDLLTTKVDKQNKEILSLKNGPPFSNTSASNGQPAPPQQLQHAQQQEQHRQSPYGQSQPQPQPPQQVRQQQGMLNRQQQPPISMNQHQQSSFTNSSLSSDVPRPNSVPDNSRQNPLHRFGNVIQPSQCAAGYRRDCVNKATCFFRHIGETVGESIPEEWKLVTNKRRKPPLFGSRRGTESTIAGQRTVREISIFVGGVNSSLSVEDSSNHVRNNLGVSPINVTQNKRNEYNQSFKLTINSTDKNIIFNAEMWDENIIIKPFRERRNPENDPRRNGLSDMSTFQFSTPL